MKDGVYIVNQQYDIEYVNSPLIKEFGQPGKKKCYTYFHDRKKVCPWCKNKDVLAGKTVRWEWYSFKNQKTYDLIDTPIKNPDGSISKLEIFRDITERKKAEEALKESEEKYRSFIERFGGIAFRGDKNFKIIFFHGAVNEITGYVEDDFVEDKVKWTDIIHKDDLPWILDDVKRAIFEKLPSSEREYRIISKDKKVKWVVERVSIIFDSSGQVIGSQGTIHDITEREKAKEALRDSEELYRAIFEQAADSLLLVDGETGELVEFNDKAHENLGYSREEFNKLKIPDFEIIESTGEVAKHIKNIIKEGHDAFETKHRTKNGEIRDILVNSRAISIRGKTFVQSILRDITNYRNAEEKLKGSQEQLRDLTAHLQSIREQERTLIAREMHDELGQSLTALKMDLSWLDRKTPKDQKPLVDRIISMRKLIDSTLQTVKRISTDLRPELLDDLGLSAAIEWQGEEFQNRTGIKCVVTLDPEEIILDQDCSTAIFRIFQETLTNVARHSHATRVTVKLKMKMGKIELRVKDNGKGITEKQISGPKSFGLIGIRERVHFLGGEVNIRGVQDKGTTVTVRIPIPKEGNAG
jgi:PAS domain S-box-containing protein